MSLENFQLPIRLIPELYKNSLIQLEEKQTSDNNLKVENLSYLGAYKKNILVLVEDEAAVYLSDNYLEFLIQILNACKLNLQDVAIVNRYQKVGVSMQQVFENLSPNLVLAFGLINQGDYALFKHMPNYQAQMEGDFTLISADTLSVIAQTPEKKKQLWLALKQYFNL